MELALEPDDVEPSDRRSTDLDDLEASVRIGLPVVPVLGGKLLADERSPLRRIPLEKVQLSLAGRAIQREQEVAVAGGDRAKDDGVGRRRQAVRQASPSGPSFSLKRRPAYPTSARTSPFRLVRMRCTR